MSVGGMDGQRWGLSRLGWMGALLLLTGCATASTGKRQAAPAPPEVQAPKAVEVPREAGAAAFESGVEAFAAQDFEAAADHFRIAIDQGAEAANTGFNLALALERQGRLPDAEAAYRAVLEDAPGHRESLLNLGALLRGAERFEEAAALYRTALKLPELSWDAALLTHLAVTERRLGQDAKAEASARRVLERHGDHPGAFLILAQIHLDRGHQDLARYFAEKASHLADDHPAVANTLGLVLLKDGEPAAAILQFEEALARDDSYAPAWVNLGALALRYRDYGAAEAAFQKAVALDPAAVEGYRHLAWALSGQQAMDPEKALAAGAAYEKVLELAGTDREALCGAAWAYATHREGYDRAQPLLTRCRDGEGTRPVERARIDAKLQAIAQVMAQPAPSATAEEGAAEAGPPAEGAAAAEDTSAEGTSAERTADEGSVVGGPAAGGAAESTAAADSRVAPGAEDEAPGVGGAGAPEGDADAPRPPASGR